MKTLDTNNIIRVIDVIRGQKNFFSGARKLI